VASEREDPVQTVSAAPSAGPPARTAVAPGSTLGRYWLERELGAGAMGVVHAAFDPDLKRRVAIKVLREANDTAEARERLLREARAMARLAHPNVVTVYEVGTTSGRDFVAMELIDGESIAAWLRGAAPGHAAILDAFIAAGRGLAAAHAAGIVHRDFKPHNVLRSRDGRIAVTDFGLARAAQDGPPVELDETLPIGAEASSQAPRTELTATGALLGTPAYMAPEQWRGGAVTPATDQFAYCVALWEALAGERPFRGPTLDDLRDQIARGPAAIDASRIPRRLRNVLRRGLDPDPARRWPSMKALLGHLARARRRPGVALAIAIAAGALATAAAVIAGLRAGPPPALACDPPRLDVTTVWSPEIAADLRARTSDAHVRILDAAHRQWQIARTAACRADPQVKQFQLVCLDGVLRRFAALRAASRQVPDAPAEELQAQLIDPEICREPSAERIPRLTLAWKDDVVAAYALLTRSSTDVPPSDRELTAAIEDPAATPCARIVATLAFATASRHPTKTRALTTSAIGLAEQCDDDRVRADLLIQDSQYHWYVPTLGKPGDSAIARAQSAAARVMQPDVAAALAEQRMRIARQLLRWDEALRMADAAVAGYRARGLQLREMRAAIQRDSLRLARGEPTDLAEVGRDVPVWRPLAVAAGQTELVRQLDALAARARFRLGDVDASHAELLRLWRAQPPTDPLVGARRITGVVVDAQGRRVAGATVAASSTLQASSAGIAVPQLATEFVTLDDRFQDPALRIVTTDAAGRFVIEDAPPVGAIAAELADRRSMPTRIADPLTLVLEPTRRIAGRVDLAGTPHTRVMLHGFVNRSLPFLLSAPIAPDGSFVLTGAPVQALGLWFAGNADRTLRSEYRTIPAGDAAVTGIRFDAGTSDRTVDAIIRSTITTPLQGASVVLLPGKPAIRIAGDLFRLQPAWRMDYLAMPVVGKQAPSAVLDRLRSGDLVAQFPHVDPGELTVCAISWIGDPLDSETGQRLFAHFAQAPVGCKHLGPRDDLAEIEAPPQPRF
jgi:tRNA A-37 threonylcarbamoyl transferase component Bud32